MQHWFYPQPVGLLAITKICENKTLLWINTLVHEACGEANITCQYIKKQTLTQFSYVVSKDESDDGDKIAFVCSLFVEIKSLLCAVYLFTFPSEDHDESRMPPSTPPPPPPPRQKKKPQQNLMIPNLPGPGSEPTRKKKSLATEEDLGMLNGRKKWRQQGYHGAQSGRQHRYECTGELLLSLYAPPGAWGRYHGGWRPSSDDSLHSWTVIPPSALDKPSIMKRYHRRRTTRWGVAACLPMMVMLHDTRFVECRWWIDGWTVKTVILTVVGFHDSGPWRHKSCQEAGKFKPQTPPLLTCFAGKTNFLTHTLFAILREMTTYV